MKGPENGETVLCVQEESDGNLKALYSLACSTSLADCWQRVEHCFDLMTHTRSDNSHDI